MELLGKGQGSPDQKSKMSTNFTRTNYLYGTRGLGDARSLGETRGFSGPRQTYVGSVERLQSNYATSTQVLPKDGFFSGLNQSQMT